MSGIVLMLSFKLKPTPSRPEVKINLTVFFSALLNVQVYEKFTPRQVGVGGFVMFAIALLWLVWIVRNDWSAPIVMIGLVIYGIGPGSLVTLLFNVLVSGSRQELAGDVGSIRGTTKNLAAAIGTAVSGTVLVGLLSSFILAFLASKPLLNDQLTSQVNLDNNISFVSNDRLLATLERSNLTPEQV